MELPPVGTVRWTAWQKVSVIRAIQNGLLTAAEVQARYLISEEELSAWQTDFERAGVAGLQLKSLRQRRRTRRVKGQHR